MFFMGQLCPMKISKEQYERIANSFPRQRGNVTQDNLQIINAILYVAENGCKWRSLPAEFGNWHSIYTRMSRWSKNGVLDRILNASNANVYYPSKSKPSLSIVPLLKFTPMGWEP